MRVELTKSELISWLKAIGGAAIISLSLSSQLGKIETNITSPIRLAHALEQGVDFWDEGPYLVQYESDSNNDQDVPYKSFAMAITFKAELAKHPGRKIGGYEQLMAAISGMEYIQKIDETSFGLIGHVLIALPDEPSALAELQEALAKNSILYAFPDGTGSLNENNVKMGQGLSIKNASA